MLRYAAGQTHSRHKHTSNVRSCCEYIVSFQNLVHTYYLWCDQGLLIILISIHRSLFCTAFNTDASVIAGISTTCFIAVNALKIHSFKKKKKVWDFFTPFWFNKFNGFKNITVDCITFQMQTHLIYATVSLHSNSAAAALVTLSSSYKEIVLLQWKYFKTTVMYLRTESLKMPPLALFLFSLFYLYN